MSRGIPNNVLQLLRAADAKHGLPQGTMQAVMHQEVGSNVNKYLSKPDSYHYGLNANGQRIAGHTGKVSTAFGPFGILESTAKDPGYGVTPLRDKSLAEQIRFSAEYLAARSKKGGLEKGLAGYGEGSGYAKQVAARLNQKIPAQAAPFPSKRMQKAEAPEEAVVPTTVAEQPVQAPIPDMPEGGATSVALNGYGHQPVNLPEAVPVQASPQEEQWTSLHKAMPQPAVRDSGVKPEEVMLASLASYAGALRKGNVLQALRGGFV